MVRMIAGSGSIHTAGELMYVLLHNADRDKLVPLYLTW